MATVDVQAPPAEAKPAVPDYLANPDAVLGDDAKWRYGRPPDYSKTRQFYEETKQSNHVAGSLPELVQNLVKNWEVEASFKPRLSDWRTIDHANYTFAINGGPPQSAEHMLKVGTYNAIITPNQYYSPANSDFTSSHKTFKRMMPHFAWEVLEVYSGPPQVSFRWRHWGQMKNDYVGFNDKGEKITVKSHGGNIDIQGVTVAKVDDAVRLQSVETWFDPLEMFRQIAPNGIVNKEIVEKKVDNGTNAAASSTPSDAANETSDDAAQSNHDEQLVKSHDKDPATQSGINVEIPLDQAGAITSRNANSQEAPDTPAATPSSRRASEDSSAWEHVSTPSSSSPKPSMYSSAVNGAEEDRLKAQSQSQPTKSSTSDADSDTKAPEPLSMTPLAEALPNDSDTAPTQHQPQESTQQHPTNNNTNTDPLETFLANPSGTVHPHPHDIEQAVHPAPGEAVAARADSAEAHATYVEMSRITGAQCPFLMNRE